MKNNNFVAYGLLALATLCWGGNVVIGRAVRGDLPPLGLSFWRWFFCCLILLFFTARKLPANWQVIRTHWKLLLAMSATGIAAFNPLQYQALHSTTAINSTLILATCPAIMALLSVFILKDKLGLAQIAGILISFFGVTFVITAGDLKTLFHLKLTIGDIWMVGAAIVWALYSITVKLRPVDLDPLVMLMVITGIGALILLPLYIWESLTYQTVTITPTNLAAIVYVTFIASLLAYFSWNKGVGLIGPSKAGVFIHLMPVWVAILAFVLLGEKIQGYHLAGVAFIAIGIILNSRRARV
ncbi:DMT family transporter [uncultured Cohaesibacter sp.]|uniref:DMT family transporter n=1 Tax=uncultured Cohaesibacter sp. TaxID=1002546 RepID=UPI0029C755C3|nr:DMT family transporter [uncultured Cohaesibacter sp.]